MKTLGLAMFMLLSACGGKTKNATGPTGGETSMASGSQAGSGDQPFSLADCKLDCEEGPPRDGFSCEAACEQKAFGACAGDAACEQRVFGGCATPCQADGSDDACLTTCSSTLGYDPCLTWCEANNTEDWVCDVACDSADN
jgi:hypothetical protein